MVSDELGVQLHDRATRGDALSEEEQRQLNDLNLPLTLPCHLLLASPPSSTWRTDNKLFSGFCMK
jgi:hypothetical protein